MSVDQAPDETSVDYSDETARDLEWRGVAAEQRAKSSEHRDRHRKQHTKGQSPAFIQRRQH